MQVTATAVLELPLHSLSHHGLADVSAQFVFALVLAPKKEEKRKEFAVCAYPDEFGRSWPVWGRFVAFIGGDGSRSSVGASVFLFTSPTTPALSWRRCSAPATLFV